MTDLWRFKGTLRSRSGEVLIADGAEVEVVHEYKTGDKAGMVRIRETGTSTSPAPSYYTFAKNIRRAP